MFCYGGHPYVGWISYQDLMVNSQVSNNALGNLRSILPFLTKRQAWDVLAVVSKHVSRLFSPLVKALGCSLGNGWPRAHFQRLVHLVVASCLYYNTQFVVSTCFPL
jgi:hypothetical protein